MRKGYEVCRPLFGSTVHIREEGVTIGGHTLTNEGVIYSNDGKDIYCTEDMYNLLVKKLYNGEEK